MPIGKRVCESPPVPTVSGSSMRFSHEWITPSPGRSEMPPRVLMNSGSVWCVFTSTGLGYGGVAERLHHQVGREAQAGQVLQLVAGHGAGGVLATDRGHLRFAVGARAHALAFRQAAGAADHLLGQRVALAGIDRVLGRRNSVDGARPSASRALAVRPRPMISGMRPPRFSNVGLHFEFSDDFAVLDGLAVVGTQFDHVAHFHLGHVQLDRQGAGVFHGVVEDRGDLAAQHTPPKRLFGTKGMSSPVNHSTGWWRTCATNPCRPRRRRRRPGGPFLAIR